MTRKSIKSTLSRVNSKQIAREWQPSRGPIGAVNMESDGRTLQCYSAKHLRVRGHNDR
jgi:hypothetical protein